MNSIIDQQRDTRDFNIYPQWMDFDLWQIQKIWEESLSYGRNQYLWFTQKLAERGLLPKYYEGLRNNAHLHGTLLKDKADYIGYH